MAPNPLRIGVSSCLMHPDPLRPLFKGKRLLYMEESMFHWVMREGAMACLLPTAAPKGLSLEEMVASLDGVIMSGGVDMAPESYGETPLKPEWSGDKLRDDYEIAVIRAALKLDKPLLGICRGLQVMNVALGGTLYQDIKTQHPDALVHRDWEIYDANQHAVRIESRAALAALYPGVKESRINSVHHQGIKDVASELSIEARCSDDGIIEAVRLKAKTAKSPFLSGVQWHPEFQDPNDKTLLSPTPVMQEFLDAVKQRRR